MPGLWDRELLERWYCEEGATQVEIARRLGCTQYGVWAALHRHGIGERRRPPVRAELADPAWLRDQYVDQRRSMATIGRILGVSTQRVRDALIAAGQHEPRPRQAASEEPVPAFPAHWRFLDEFE